MNVGTSPGQGFQGSQMPLQGGQYAPNFPSLPQQQQQHIRSTQQQGPQQQQGTSYGQGPLGALPETNTGALNTSSGYMQSFDAGSGPLGGNFDQRRFVQQAQPLQQSSSQQQQQVGSIGSGRRDILDLFDSSQNVANSTGFDGVQQGAGTFGVEDKFAGMKGQRYVGTQSATGSLLPQQTDTRQSGSGGTGMLPGNMQMPQMPYDSMQGTQQMGPNGGMMGRSRDMGNFGMTNTGNVGNMGVGVGNVNVDGSGGGGRTGAPLSSRRYTTFYQQTGRFPCRSCGEVFPQKRARDAHIRSAHEKERNFKCERCPSRFKTRSDCNRHNRIVHERIRPFPCHLCSGAFAERGKLKRHISTVHDKIRPHACPECGACFGERGNLNQHRASKHAPPPQAQNLQ